jgi:hypothetical protein
MQIIPTELQLPDVVLFSYQHYSALLESKEISQSTKSIMLRLFNTCCEQYDLSVQ